MMKAGIQRQDLVRCLQKHHVALLKSLISAFIICYVSVILVFLSPKTALTNAITGSIKPWWFFAGFQQRWELFSPSIRTLNVHTVAMVTFENGTVTLWELPRLEQMNAFDKFRKDKLRKWAADSVPWEPYKQFWPDLARYVGRIHYDPKNKPVSLTLLRLTADIPPPSVAVRRELFAPHTKLSTCFSYRFSPEDFR